MALATRRRQFEAFTSNFLMTTFSESIPQNDASRDDPLLDECYSAMVVNREGALLLGGNEPASSLPCWVAIVVS